MQGLAYVYGVLAHTLLAAGIEEFTVAREAICSSNWCDYLLHL